MHSKRILTRKLRNEMLICKKYAIKSRKKFFGGFYTWEILKNKRNYSFQSLIQFFQQCCILKQGFQNFSWGMSKEFKDGVKLFIAIYNRNSGPPSAEKFGWIRPIFAENDLVKVLVLSKNVKIRDIFDHRTPLRPQIKTSSIVHCSPPSTWTNPKRANFCDLRCF